MSDPEQVPPSGWTVGKVIGLVVGLLGLVGFGICGLCGIVLGVSDRGLAEVALPAGIVGLGIAAFGFLLVRRMVRLARGASRQDP